MNLFAFKFCSFYANVAVFAVDWSHGRVLVQVEKSEREYAAVVATAGMFGVQLWSSTAGHALAL